MKKIKSWKVRTREEVVFKTGTNILGLWSCKSDPVEKDKLIF